MTVYKYATEGIKSSTYNKIKELLLNGLKLVLIQQHELERIKHKRTYSPADSFFVDYLFDHYLINKGLKTYLL